MEEDFQQLVIRAEKEENQKEQRRQDIFKIDDLDLLKDLALNDDDWIVRKIAVLKIDDESVLADVAKNDENQYVRKAAISGIHDNDILRYVVENDGAWCCRYMALKNCSDEKLLTEVFLSDDDHFIRDCAKRQLRKEFPLSSMVVKPVDIRNINDEEKLESIVFSNIDFAARMEAFRKIEDKDIIRHVAFKSHDYRLVNMAIEKIDDEESLRKLYSSTELKDSKIAIVKKLGDENLAKELILDREYNFGSYGLLSMISDESILAEIARADIRYGFGIISNRAKEKLRTLYPNSLYLKPFDISIFDSQEELYSYAKYSLDSESSLKAVAHIKDKSMLFDLAMNSYDSDLAALACEKIDDNEDLKKVALSASFHQSRIKAISKIDDDDILVDMLKVSGPSTRSHILQSITDESIIVHVYENDPNERVRKDAVKFIRDEDFLKVLAKSDDIIVRRNAIKNIKDQQFLLDFLTYESNNINLEYACENIEDEEIIYSIFKENRLPIILSPSQFIDNEELLISLALDKDVHFYARVKSIEKITDQKTLETLSGEEGVIRHAVVQNPNFNNQEILTDIALNDYSADVRGDAVGKIKNQQVLGEIALNDSAYRVCRCAIEHIDDDLILRDVAFGTGNRFAFEDAIKKIQDKSILFGIKENLDENDPIYDKKIYELEFRGIK